MLVARPPGDKSISHRALILAALADGRSTLQGLLAARDVRSTASALRAIGVDVPELPGSPDARIEIDGRAPFRDARELLDCENSGTTSRLLIGLLTGLGLSATLDGDASLRSRPMDRVVYPLQAMGAQIRYAGALGRLPIRVEGRASGSLRPLRHRARVASAQVKSAILLAGLCGRVKVEVIEPALSRDHTERMLRAMGAPIESEAHGVGARVTLDAEGWDGSLTPLDLAVPGDPSAAAMLATAALLAEKPIRLSGLSLNETRTAFFGVLDRMGATVRARALGEAAGEPVGEIEVLPGDLAPFEIAPEEVPRLIDEIPALAVLASRIDGVSRILGAAEARLKESDRLAMVACNLAGLGVECTERQDGLDVTGSSRPVSGRIVSGGDHRIAMAFATLGVAPGCRIEIDVPDCVDVSFPTFWEELARVAA